MGSETSPGSVGIGSIGSSSTKQSQVPGGINEGLSYSLDKPKVVTARGPGSSMGTPKYPNLPLTPSSQHAAHNPTPDHRSSFVFEKGILEVSARAQPAFSPTICLWMPQGPRPRELEVHRTTESSPAAQTLARRMLVLLPLQSTRKMNSPAAFCRSAGAVLSSGQKFSMRTGWWGMSLCRRFRMISVCREEGEGVRIQESDFSASFFH